MKFSTAAIILAASYSAVSMPGAEASPVANPGFLKSLCSSKSLFGLFGAPGGGSGANDNNTNNDNNNANNNNNSNQIQNIIYIVPGGYMTNGNTVTGSIPFTGTVVNGVLYVNAPNFSNGLGSVKVNSNGQLQVVQEGGATATGSAPAPTSTGSHAASAPHSSTNWLVENNELKPNGVKIMSCPDQSGNKYLYAGIQCPGGTTLALKTQNHTSLDQGSGSDNRWGWNWGWW